MGQRYLIDSNVLIDYTALRLPPPRLVHNLTLISPNTKDFQGIDGLT